MQPAVQIGLRRRILGLSEAAQRIKAEDLSDCPFLASLRLLCNPALPPLEFYQPFRYPRPQDASQLDHCAALPPARLKFPLRKKAVILDGKRRALDSPGFKSRGFLAQFDPARTATVVLPVISMSFRCDDCDQTFDNSGTRSRHRWSRHSVIPTIIVAGTKYTVTREDGKLQCPIAQCGHSYTAREKFVQHTKKAHGVVSRSPTASSSPAGSLQRSIHNQRLHAPSSPGKPHTTSPQFLILILLSGCGLDRGGEEALAHTLSSVACEGRSQVPLDPPEHGEILSCVSRVKNCVLKFSLKGPPA